MGLLPRLRGHPVQVAAGALLVLGLTILVVTRLGSSDRPTRDVPRSIVSDCSRPADPELNAWLATVPDGVTVNFRARTCYAQEQPLLLKKRKGLVINGHGATFKSFAQNDNTKLVPNWFLMRSQRIRLTNMVIVGNFDDLGPPSPQRGAVTSNAGVGIYGGREIDVINVAIRHVFGDGVTVANANYHDNEDPTPEFSQNVRLRHLDITDAARHCVSPDEVTGFWLEDSKLNNCYLDGVDAEKDHLSDPMSDLHFLRNTFSNYFSVGLVIAIGGAPGNTPARGYEIRGNRFLTLPLAATCNPAITVGGYENQFFENVVIEDNHILSWKAGIDVIRIRSGRISNNTFTHPTQGTNGNAPPRSQDCGPDHEANVGAVESGNILVSNNG